MFLYMKALKYSEEPVLLNVFLAEKSTKIFK